MKLTVQGREAYAYTGGKPFDTGKPCVVLIHGGYIVAEGAVEGVRDEMADERPLQVLVRCDRPSELAARVFAEDHVVEARCV